MRYILVLATLFVMMMTDVVSPVKAAADKALDTLLTGKTESIEVYEPTNQAYVVPGATLDYEVKFTGAGEYPTDVIWSVSGNNSPATVIDKTSGVLNIASNETATSITIEATTEDSSASSDDLTIQIDKDSDGDGIPDEIDPETNHAPVVANVSLTTGENTPLSGTLTGTDADNDALTYSLVGQPSNGTVVVNSDGTFTYTPNADYVGTDTFTYKANDGTVDSSLATVTINVTPVSNPPALVGVTGTTGTSFRTIDITPTYTGDATKIYYVAVQNEVDAKTQFNLDTQTGIKSIATTPFASLTGNQQQMIKEGKVARGEVTAPASGSQVTITGQDGSAIDKTLEPGLIDGYSYTIYVAVDDSATPPVKTSASIMSMPFASGDGTSTTPYVINEVDVTNYPDLKFGTTPTYYWDGTAFVVDPVSNVKYTGTTYNLVSGDQTGRMLANINRMTRIENPAVGSGSVSIPVTTYFDASYEMTSDIDITCYQGGNGWVPIAPQGYNSNAVFTGDFSGNGHMITGLKINSTNEYDNIGLFGTVTGTSSDYANISDFTILNPDISSTSWNVGAAVGSSKYAILQGISVEGGAVESDEDQIGGIVGNGEIGTTIEDCNSSASVSGHYSIGGIVGYCEADISRCYSTGDITADSNGGGLIGYSMSGTTENSFATGNVIGSGGFVGTAKGTFINCFSTGDVTGVVGMGGFTANASGSSSFTNCYCTGNVTYIGTNAANSVGGFAGGIGSTSYFPSINNCVAMGSEVDGGISTKVGSFAGNSSVTVTDGYYNSDMTITSSNTAIVIPGTSGVPLAQMDEVWFETLLTDSWNTSGQAVSKVDYESNQAPFDETKPWVWNEQYGIPMFYNDENDDGIIDMNQTSQLLQSTSNIVNGETSLATRPEDEESDDVTTSTPTTE